MTLSLRAFVALCACALLACNGPPFAGAIERRGARVSVWARAEDEVPEVAVAHMDALVRIAQDALGERARTHRVLVHPAESTDDCLIDPDVRRRCVYPSGESTVDRDLSDASVIYGVLLRAHRGHPALLRAISEALGDGSFDDRWEIAPLERAADGRLRPDGLSAQGYWRELASMVVAQRGASAAIAWYRASNERMDEPQLGVALERAIGAPLSSLGPVREDRSREALGPWSRAALCAGPDNVEISEHRPRSIDGYWRYIEPLDLPPTARLPALWGAADARAHRVGVARFVVRDPRWIRLSNRDPNDERDPESTRLHRVTIVSCPSAALVEGFESPSDGVFALPVGRYALRVDARLPARPFELGLSYATAAPTHESLTADQQIPRMRRPLWSPWGPTEQPTHGVQWDPVRFAPSGELAPAAPSLRLFAATGAYVMRTRNTQWPVREGRATLVLMAHDELETTAQSTRSLEIEGWSRAWGPITVRQCYDPGRGLRCEQSEWREQPIALRGVVVIRAPVRPELLTLRFTGARIEPYER